MRLLHCLHRILPLVAATVFAISAASAGETRGWDEITAAARGQTVYFNAWAGDPQTNAFIAQVGAEAVKHYASGSSM